MKRQICVVSAVAVEDQRMIGSKVKAVLERLELTYLLHEFHGRDIREIFALKCEGPYLIICNEGHTTAVDTLEEHELGEIHVISLAKPRDLREVSIQRAYCSLDRLETQMELSVGAMLRV